MTLAAFDDPGLCPDCGELMLVTVSDQPALFLHGGYGATERVAMVSCAGCGYVLTREVASVRPDGTTMPNRGDD